MEKILAFHFNDTELFQLRQLAATLKFHLVPVADTDYMQPLSALASGKKKSSGSSPHRKGTRGKSLTVMRFYRKTDGQAPARLTKKQLTDRL